MKRAVILGIIASAVSIISSMGLVFLLAKDIYALGLISTILVGLAIYLGSGFKKEHRFGMLAVVISLITIVGGKFLIAEAIARTNNDTLVGMFSDDRFFISQMTGQAISELKEKSDTLNWPEGMNEKNAARPGDFPPEVWKRATELYEALPAEEKEAKRNAQKNLNKTLNFNGMIAVFRVKLLKESFSIRQIILSLALLSIAYGVGSGMYFE